MYLFNSDYTEGCTPEILEALSACNMQQTGGYGSDAYTEAAVALIKKECGTPDAEVHLMMAGTQTNLTIINAALRPHHGVYATFQSHIYTHEGGAIEHTGHKVIALPSSDGKITAKMIIEAHEQYLSDPSRVHWVKPKMVYISNPTELGSLYKKAELNELYAVCKQYGLYLFIDGARLGYGLTAPDCDMTMKDIAATCDVFCIGGTKCGALFGEAAVLVNPKLHEDFHTLAKQCGAVLAKGRLLGIQFEALFMDGLYYRICKHGVDLAMQIKEALTEKKLELVTDSNTNQLFVIFPEEMYNDLSKHFYFSLITPPANGKVVARICTSWATSKTETEKLCKMIREY